MKSQQSKNQAVKGKKVGNIKSKKIKRVVIQGRPVHRRSTNGCSFNANFSSFGAYVRSYRTLELTEKQIQAFRKALTHKKLRKMFRIQTLPYLTLTKKPAQVRMGKGRGTKIGRNIVPLIPGQSIFNIKGIAEGSSSYGNPFILNIMGVITLRKAAKKLPPMSYKVRSFDL